ncbi:MAG: nuclear transport factor 2 family protein [Rhizomicrobium sp.]
MAQSGESSSDALDVADAMRAMYAAAAVDDMDRLRDIFDDGFYAYDMGKRFDGMAMAELIKLAHAAGQVFVWEVNEPDVHVMGDWAWIAYVNRGSVTKGSETQLVSWLESAILRRHGAGWRIRFFHSTRVPAE